jgi:hypothetical protein
MTDAASLITAQNAHYRLLHWASGHGAQPAAMGMLRLRLRPSGASSIGADQGPTQHCHKPSQVALIQRAGIHSTSVVRHNCDTRPFGHSVPPSGHGRAQQASGTERAGRQMRTPLLAPAKGHRILTIKGTEILAKLDGGAGAPTVISRRQQSTGCIMVAALLYKHLCGLHVAWGKPIQPASAKWCNTILQWRDHRAGSCLLLSVSKRNTIVQCAEQSLQNRQHN